MNSFLNELVQGWPDAEQLGRIVFRLVAALLLGGLIGWQREHARKPAGLRTHMLVSMGACLFVMAGIEHGFSNADQSRVIQGLATGIGFIGGGAILKMAAEHEIKGLTTAAGIWTTAAVGAVVGLGHWGLATLGVALTLITLAVLVRLEIPTSKHDE